MNNEIKFDVAFKIRIKHGFIQRYLEEHNMTQADLSRALGIDQATFGRWINLKDYPRTEEKIEKVCNYFKETPDVLFPEFIKDPLFRGLPKEQTIYKEVDLQYLPYYSVPEITYEPDYNGFELKENIDKVLKTLSPKEEQVIKLRTGIKAEYTLEQTARYMGLTRERIRQIERKAYRKLKQLSRTKALHRRFDKEYKENETIS